MFWVGLLVGLPLGALLLGFVLAVLERDSGARGYVDLTGRRLDDGLTPIETERLWP